MRWSVEGADSKSGRDRLLSIDADSAHEAEQLARRQGVLVAAVHRAKVLSPAERLEHMLAGTADETMVTAREHESVPPHPAPAAGDPADQTIAYRSSPPDADTSPLVRFAQASRAANYINLRIAGTVLFVLAMLCYLAGIFSISVAAVTLSEGLYWTRSAAGILATIMGLAPALSPLVIGAVLHALSGICYALRDIARDGRGSI